MPFTKGYTPWNKGMKGYTNAGSFKKGQKNAFVAKANKKYRRGFQKGHPNYFKGSGKTSIDRLERQKFRNEIQRQVFERDSYTCQLCGSGGNLQVDHIQSWKDYVELMFDINNCRTLCAFVAFPMFLHHV